MLTPRKIYNVRPDESAAKSSYLRIVDNEGENYLYPASHFVLVSFTPEVERAILRAA